MPDTSDVVLRVEGLGKRYRIGAREERATTLSKAAARVLKSPFAYLASVLRPPREDEIIWALKDVSFEVKRGEVVGIIGRNGAGKSTLLKILSRITEPTEGRAEIRGRVGSLLEVGTGFHPELTGRENIYLNGAILGMKKAEIDRKFDEIVAFAEVEKFIDTPVKRYSSGMYVRLAFAVAAHLEPEILLVDEVLAVGDAAFQKKCLGKMQAMATQERTVLFVTHNMPMTLNLCTAGILLDNGRVHAQGTMAATVQEYMKKTSSSASAADFPRRDPDGLKLAFRSVRILDDKGLAVSQVLLPKGFTVQLTYEVYRPLRGVQVAFELWNSMGICVLCSTNLDSEPEAVARTTPAGEYRTRCFVPGTFLRPGRYLLTLSASIPGLEVLAEEKEAVGFDVVDCEGPEAKLAQGRRGAVAPILSWYTERV